MNWYLKCLSNYAVFSGRARRTEFWMFCLFNGLFAIAASIIGNFICAIVEVDFNIVSALYSLAMIVPTISVSVRRLHDTDKSGWWFLIGLIPIAGALVLLIFYCLDGTAGTNKYGIDPKGRGGRGSSYSGGGSNNYRPSGNDDYLIQ